RPGPLATVQDGGRPGYAGVGLGRAGACDRRAWRLGNRLVGNHPDAAGVEITMGGLQVRAEHAVTVALTGAFCPVAVDHRTTDHDRPLHLPAGAVLALGRPARGVRTYLAVRGGIDAPVVLGSRSTDLRAGLGASALVTGATLPVGDLVSTDVPPVDVPGESAAAEEVWVRVVLGPRDGWFTQAALDHLLTSAWRVTTDADRVGLRLDGPALQRARTEELPTEGCVRGAVQVPGDGKPIVFLADHPVTGGYPVVAVVVDADTDLLAQARPGTVVRFSRRG
ncbi:MAG TPA: biotin-dependent carboxyltransferase family protein, partial [Nocardioidaceae bacterium]|nr:biotin-dependent carboxyltransferase family protein [Nocardioidaceae bacterium]